MDTTASVLTENHRRSREAIRITLAHRAGAAADARAVADATIGTWRQLESLLAPVIGKQGVDVIFRRALHLSSNRFSWLAFGEEFVDSAVLLASLQARLASRQPDEVAEAGYALLVNFTELLTTLIGEALSERMLRQVWFFPASSEQEIES